MNFMNFKRLHRFKNILATMLLMILPACPSSWQIGDSLFLQSKIKARMTAVDIEFYLPDLKRVKLGAELLTPPQSAFFVSPKTVVIFVPGSGIVSRYARQTGNGIDTYAQPVDINMQWANVLAQQGYFSLAYDKRSCGPSHEDVCLNNPLSDFNQEGPKALARDVDAACLFVRDRFGEGVRIVLWTSEQGSQVVLSSACKNRASVLVFVTPIPYRIDKFWVEGLFHASRTAREPLVKNSLMQKARNLQATFESIKKGQFALDSKVMGATLPFWKEWIVLTQQADALLAKTHQPMILIMGEDDAFYNEKARYVLKKQMRTTERQLVQLPGVDHNLLKNGVLAQETIDTVLGALVKSLKRD
jgi:pimeloyl-ACP methyl ester carboxylesterase